LEGAALSQPAARIILSFFKDIEHFFSAFWFWHRRRNCGFCDTAPYRDQSLWTVACLSSAEQQSEFLSDPSLAGALFCRLCQEDDKPPDIPRLMRKRLKEAQDEYEKSRFGGARKKSR
jgi:hypothetical protein